MVQVPWRLGCFLHMTNLLLMLFIPIVVINVKSSLVNPGGATLVTITYSILFIKMWSYIQVMTMMRMMRMRMMKVNHWCRCSATILGGRENKLTRHQSIYRQVQRQGLHGRLMVLTYADLQDQGQEPVPGHLPHHHGGEGGADDSQLQERQSLSP